MNIAHIIVLQLCNVVNNPILAIILQHIENHGNMAVHLILTQVSIKLNKFDM